MYRANIFAALLGSATAAMGVLSLASPANAIQWSLNNVAITGNTAATTVTFNPPPTTVDTVNGTIGAGSGVTGSFDWDGSNLTNVSITALLNGLVGFPSPSISTLYTSATPVSAGGSLSSLSFGGTSGGVTNTLTLDFNLPLASNAGLGSVSSVSGGTFSYATPSDPNAVNIYSISGSIPPQGTAATPIPWETDSLPLIGSTILFGVAIQVRRKLAIKKNKDLS